MSLAEPRRAWVRSKIPSSELDKEMPNHRDNRKFHDHKNRSRAEPRPPPSGFNRRAFLKSPLMLHRRDDQIRLESANPPALGFAHQQLPPRPRQHRPHMLPIHQIRKFPSPRSARTKHSRSRPVALLRPTFLFPLPVLRGRARVGVPSFNLSLTRQFHRIFNLPAAAKSPAKYRRFQHAASA